MTALPPPVARFRNLVDTRILVETVLIDTTAVMRRPGMPPIPLEIRMAHRLGHDCSSTTSGSVVAWSRSALGSDAYVDGHGLMKVGPSVQTGPHFDQGALIALWGEALGFPSAWEHRDDVRLGSGGLHHRAAHRPGARRRDPDHRWVRPSDRVPCDVRGRSLQVDGPEGSLDRAVEQLAPLRGRGARARQVHGPVGGQPRPWIDIRTGALSGIAMVDDALRLGRDALHAARPQLATSGRRGAAP